MLAYRLTHQTGTVDIALDGDRLVVKTKGNGLADKLRTIDIALADLRRFAVTPTKGYQDGPARHSARDAELLFSYAEGGKIRKKRVFVLSRDPAFGALVAELRAKRPDASLLDAPPAEAYRGVGVLSPGQGVMVVFAVSLALPLAVIAIVLLIEGFSGRG